MAEALALAQKLGGVSFATLLVLIGFGSYWRIWCWGYQLEEAKAATLKAEATSERWQAMALELGGIAKTSVTLATQTRVP